MLARLLSRARGHGDERGSSQVIGRHRSAAVSQFAGRRSLALALLSPRPALADLGDEIPKAGYYAAINELYTGDYRHAERDFAALSAAQSKR